MKICHNDSNPPRDRVSALGFHGELRNPFEQNLVVDQSLQEESGHEDWVLLTTGDELAGCKVVSLQAVSRVGLGSLQITHCDGSLFPSVRENGGFD